MPEFDLTVIEADELLLLLDGAVGGLSFEIADTDNPDFRGGLRQRRNRLNAVRAALLANRNVLSVAGESHAESNARPQERASEDIQGKANVYQPRQADRRRHDQHRRANCRGRAGQGRPGPPAPRQRRRARTKSRGPEAPAPADGLGDEGRRAGTADYPLHGFGQRPCPASIDEEPASQDSTVGHPCDSSRQRDGAKGPELHRRPHRHQQLVWQVVDRVISDVRIRSRDRGGPVAQAWPGPLR
jgi:hypothetical protein